MGLMAKVVSIHFLSSYVSVIGLAGTVSHGAVTGIQFFYYDEPYSSYTKTVDTNS